VNAAAATAKRRADGGRPGSPGRVAAGSGAPRTPVAEQRGGERLEWRTGDGATIVAFRFDAAAPRAAAVVGAAMGVPQDFYGAFASWLAGLGITAFTFDYRGIGHSAPRSLRGFRATITDWARHDYERALSEAATAANGRPLFVVGHSLGAQLPALAPSGGQVDAMVAVAGGGGYWGGLAPVLRPFMLSMVGIAAPIAIPLAGYFPGRRLRMIGDLPAGAMRQWSRWCLHPEYLVGVEPGAREAYARARFEILSLSFSDDWMMPQRNVDSLHAHFRSARRESRRIGPAQAGGPIGHMGFFRSRYRDTLWPIAGDWLLERAAAPRREREDEDQHAHEHGHTGDET
jgi:predicted alpha/beta hydrolase